MKILGLDLGVASIGWALIDTPAENPTSSKISIKGMGCLLINNSSESLHNFQKGVGQTANNHRRILRSQRNRQHHAQRRRFKLENFLWEHHITLSKIDEEKLRLWELRSLATTKKLELEDLARVLIHLSKKRGHVSGNKVPDGYTIGEYVFKQLGQNPDFRVKGLEFSRAEHVRELEIILHCQSKFYPEFLTSENINRLIHRIIFFDYRRKDRAATKRLCTLETKEHIRSKNSGKSYSAQFGKSFKKYAPTAALRSNPLYQNFSTLCQLQHVKVYRCNDDEDQGRPLTVEEQIRLFNHLQVNAYISLKDIPRILDLGKDVHCRKVASSPDVPFSVPFYCRKITGNQTYAELYNILGDKYAHLLKFDLPIVGQDQSIPPTSDQSIPTSLSTHIYNKVYEGKANEDRVHEEIYNGNRPDSSAHVLSSLDDSVLEEPLYQLWRDIFSIRDKKVLSRVLKTKYGIIEQNLLDKLCIVNFYSYGFSDTSIKSIRRLMPLMLQGVHLQDACRSLGYVKTASFGYEHYSNESDRSQSENSFCPERPKRMRPNLASNIDNSVVQKVLNKLISLVNKLLAQYGDFDSIHIELARELWMSASEREKYFIQNQRNQQDYLRFTKKLQSMGVVVSQRALEKFKIWEESDGCCIYCGAKIPLKEYITGQVGEIEHIIPRSLQFNDSLNNKACACRRCNQAKGSLTAYEYIVSQGDKVLGEYTRRIDLLYKKKKISRQKHENLTTKATELSDEFISSQLVASRHIASKALEMLSEICPQVIPTNGIFTSFLRNKWGYNTILHDLNLPYYRALSQVEVRTVNLEDNQGLRRQNQKKSQNNSQGSTTAERIQGWSKRLDHRNHALDALVIALTSPDLMNGIYGMRHNKTRGISSDKLALSQPRPTLAKVRKAIENIIVVHSPNDDKVRWSYRTNEFDHIRTLTPKCALHRESLYGEIQRIDPKDKKHKLCRMKVIRVPLEEIDTEKKAERVVDLKLKALIKERLNNIKEIKEIEEVKGAETVEIENESPDSIIRSDTNTCPALYSDSASKQQVRYVRCFSYHQNLAPLRYDERGRAISFVRTDNNHHLSIYRLPSGKYLEKAVSFFDYARLRHIGLNGVIIDSKSFTKDLSMRNVTLDELLQQCIPPVEAEHVLTLMKNQLYILGLTDKQIAKAVKQGDIPFLSQHIYRVQGISSCNYRFALHTQSETALKNFNRPDGRFLLFCSISKFIDTNPRRVIVDMLGRIRVL